MQLDRIVAALLGFTLLVGSARAEEAPKAPRPFDVYLGAPARQVVSQSRVEGARGAVELEPVLQGDILRHRFVLTNPTDQPLTLKLPRTCSGCVLDGYSQEIPAGGEGSLAIVIPTDALGGQRVAGTIRIETGSAELPLIEIDVGLDVREFAKLEPYRVWLRGRVGEEIVETAIVEPNPAYDFRITGIRPRKGIWFTYDLEEVEREGRRAYAIRIANTRRKPGPYQDVLFVQTDHPERPEFKIRIEGRIEE